MREGADPDDRIVARVVQLVAEKAYMYYDRPDLVCAWCNSRWSIDIDNESDCHEEDCLVTLVNDRTMVRVGDVVNTANTENRENSQ